VGALVSEGIGQPSDIRARFSSHQRNGAEHLTPTVLYNQGSGLDLAGTGLVQDAGQPQLKHRCVGVGARIYAVSLDVFAVRFRVRAYGLA